jgi:excinuclease ABC subunit A
MSGSDAGPRPIRLRGVRHNNLKGWDIDIPAGKLVVVTGLSGAGKSSLVFDTLHAEGHRRYAETFSAYTRQFLDMLDRPRVDGIDNIRPSIAVEQGGAVRTSRSTVGTMTELCDYAKVWFSQVATLYDPATGHALTSDSAQSIWKQVAAGWPGHTVLLAFSLPHSARFDWEQIRRPLLAQGYTRCLGPAADDGSRPAWRIEEMDDAQAARCQPLIVVQDRLTVAADEAERFIESAATALHFGDGALAVHDASGRLLRVFSSGLRSPVDGRVFREATPALFSFNSAVGACPQCRGFGRIIRIDPGLVIPDSSLTLAGGAIRSFSGAVYSASLKDLVRNCRARGVRTDVPWRDLPAADQAWVWAGDPDYVEERDGPGRGWYGIDRFFSWLESNTYKMHVRVFLAKYRSYLVCPACNGDRLQPESLLWRWQGHTLADLYRMPVSRLAVLMRGVAVADAGGTPGPALDGMLTRLGYLEAVGLGYLSLDRSSRTLSGGETQRVNLTACLGTSLVDTLFVLDEPSIGLHPRDIDRLIAILRQLTRNGNTVVVVEHDEAVMRAADQLIEIGPAAGAAGGQLVFQGTVADAQRQQACLTGRYLAGIHVLDDRGRQRRVGPVAASRPAGDGATKGRPKSGQPPRPSHEWLRLRGVTQHNLQAFDCDIPLNRLVVISGVSGSGKSTLLHDAVYGGLMARAGRSVDRVARIAAIECDAGFAEIVRVDQTPLSRTPRSNAALYLEVWDKIRTLYSQTDEARAAGLTASHFSFNSGDGRCPHCEGLGYERIEMQFMADVYTPCPHCDGERFGATVRAVQWRGKSVSDLLRLTVREAMAHFVGHAEILGRLRVMAAVGLDYLPLGQPLNTLSGGESQRLKLVKYAGRATIAGGSALLLLDEPTTGLHRDDVGRLLDLLQLLVDNGHSLVVIEHQTDVIAAADWVLELGPEPGEGGGALVFCGTPSQLAQAATATGAALRDAKRGRSAPEQTVGTDLRGLAVAAEAKARFRKAGSRTAAGASAAGTGSGTAAPESAPDFEFPHEIRIEGAREHNLKNISLSIPLGKMTVVTGVSGSGKSTLAFDILFAEGQRRFMESMSSWARQFVDQLPKPAVDRITAIPPAVAIEQRVSRGSGKSTVATVTEVAQYLRLLYARLGVQHHPRTGCALEALSTAEIGDRMRALLAGRGAPVKARSKPVRSTAHWLCAPLVRGRKGHHEPLANWARTAGYEALIIDGTWTPLAEFEKLDRYREHDVDLVMMEVRLAANGDLVIRHRGEPVAATAAIGEVLTRGKGVCYIAGPVGDRLSWFSSTNSDPETGEAFPQLDPRHFSWNSPKGWCPACLGHGTVQPRDPEVEAAAVDDELPPGEVCPTCNGDRLNPTSRAVYLFFKDGTRLNLPGLLALTAGAVATRLDGLRLDARGTAVMAELLPEISERLRFLDAVGLHYLALDRSARTLSGGEAQRIRLAAQLGSNLSGALYVLDEPSIGLHPRDNDRLLAMLDQLKARGNTLLVVEHDEDTMRAADHIIDLGPGAGIHGGEVLATGDYAALLREPRSLTGRMLRAAEQGNTAPLRAVVVPRLPATARAALAAGCWLGIDQPQLRNLQGGLALFPHGHLTVVCGVSGAGKSTLVLDLLKPQVAAALAAGRSVVEGPPGSDFKRIFGIGDFGAVIEVDQSPIGKTPRSTPATYIGAWDKIRRLFGMLPEARMHGYAASTFSFNTHGGRCAACQGAGRIRLEMNFLPDAYLPCTECGESRFGRELREIRLNGANIGDVLAMSFEQAAQFFAFETQLAAMLKLMVETGLGYLTLGQSSPTLSGGEAQRLKLVSELAAGLPSLQQRRLGVNRRNLYILEEPTIGLHMSDCQRLIGLLHRLVEQGHTVIVIEHNLDVIRAADHVLELGPDGGAAGGQLLFQGSVVGLAACDASPTGEFLRRAGG